jgi:hypothetical protein
MSDCWAIRRAFTARSKDVYTRLASSVEKSLQDSLAESARLAGENIKPAVEAALTGIAREAKLMHERTIASTQIHLDGFSARFGDTANRLAETWLAVLARHQNSSECLVSGMERSLAAFNATFEQRSGTLLAAVSETFSTALADQAAGDRQRLTAWTRSLESMAASLRHEWQQVGAQTLAGQEKICSTLEKRTRDISDRAQANASKTLDETTRLLNCAGELLRSRIAAESGWITEHGERMDQLARLWRAELGALREQEALRGDAAVERLGDLQAALASHLTTLGTALEEPMARLIETASVAPRAAAEVIEQLRQEMTGSMARDNQLLEERGRIMETLDALLAAINHATTEQRATIDSLVASSTLLLGQAGSQFGEQVGAESARLSEISAQVVSSAVEVSSLSEAFGFAVQLFSEANEKLIENLQRIEASMDKSTARSDDQLAYYVAQAREIIDLSIMSQKEVVEELRQFTDKPATTAEQVN